MKTNIAATKFWMIAASLSAGVLGFGGCTDYVGVGYGSAYYVPDYTPFYGAYYYDGVPYWGPNVYYTRKKVIVKDVDKHVNVNRNIYYGGHHFARDWHGSRAVARTAFPGGAVHRDRR
jgi:hypothetical protein